MNTLRECKQCHQELICIDVEAQMYTKLQTYYLVKDIQEHETWETCNPNNMFVAYCNVCFSDRLDECKKRVIGSRCL